MCPGFPPQQSIRFPVVSELASSEVPGRRKPLLGSAEGSRPRGSTGGSVRSVSGWAPCGHRSRGTGRASSRPSSMRRSSCLTSFRRRACARPPPIQMGERGRTLTRFSWEVAGFPWEVRGKRLPGTSPPAGRRHPEASVSTWFRPPFRSPFGPSRRASSACRGLPYIQRGEKGRRYSGFRWEVCHFRWEVGGNRRVGGSWVFGGRLVGGSWEPEPCRPGEDGPTCGV